MKRNKLIARHQIQGPGASIAHASIVVAALTSLASADILTWDNPLGGSASNSSNWTPAQVPAFDDDLVFNLNNVYSVTFNALTNTVLSHTYRNGDVTLTISSPHTVSTLFRIADSFGTAPTVELVSGTLTVDVSPVFGLVNGSNGFLDVTSAASLFQTSGSTSDIIVGQLGLGVLSVNDGAEVISSDDIVIGNLAGGFGQVNVRGLSLAPLQVSYLHTTAVNGDIFVGNNGSGQLHVEDLGYVETSDDMFIAISPGGDGHVDVGFGDTQATLEIADDLDIARNDTVSAGGDGQIVMITNGIATVGGTTRVGDPDGGTGALRMGGGDFTTGSLEFATNGNGIFDFQKGFVNVDGGPMIFPSLNYLLEGLLPADLPTLRLSNGSTSSLNLLRLGNVTRGRLQLSGDGTSLTLGATVHTLGDTASGEGRIEMFKGNATLTGVNAVLRVGDEGSGFLAMFDGSQVTIGSCQAAVAPGSFGDVFLSDPGTTLQTSGGISIGGSPTTSGGTAELTLNADAFVNVMGGNGLDVWPNGSMRIINSTVTVSTDATLRGDCEMTNGILNADLVEIQNADLEGSGQINARVLVGAAASTITATSTLTMGDPAATDGFSNNGGLVVGSETVTIHDANLASVSGGGDQLTITTGVLNVPNGTLHSASDVLTGFGTIHGHFHNSGTITPTQSGLHFSGTIFGVGAGIAGTRIHFDGTGGFEGAGVIAAIINSDPGTLINLTGNSTLGSNMSTLGFLHHGTMHLNGHTVALLDSTECDLGVLTTLDNGTLVAVIARLDFGDTLRGAGTINGQLHNRSYGTVQPGNSAGQLTINGNYLQDTDNAGSLEIEIGGTLAAQYDRLIVNGLAFLGGTLRADLINGFVPAVGNQFTVVDSIATLGGFTEHQFQSPGPGKGWVLIDTGTDIILRVVPLCQGDVNHDGFVNVIDLLAVIDAWGACGGCAADVSPANTGDGVVNVADLLVIITTWGPCP